MPGFLAWETEYLDILLPGWVRLRKKQFGVYMGVLVVRKMKSEI